jgi:basic amino acid/polyamine antiporter, APA family
MKFEGAMKFERSIGRWAMVGLIVNGIIGSGIFGVPSELNRLLGSASPLAMLVAGLAMAIIIACYAEVASQFSEHGGVYLYARVAFGRFAGVQVGWFWLLSSVASGGASANLFVIYLASIWPTAAHGWVRALVLTLLIAIPTVANYLGVRAGADMSSALAVAKLLPLGLLIVLGLGRFHQQVHAIHASQIVAPGWAAWASALILLFFTYDGFEDCLVPVGEVREPRRTVPFALFAGLLVTMVVYALLQLMTVATIGTRVTDHPLADAAAIIVGRGGAAFVAIAVMCSTYGWISASILNAPRLPYSFVEHGDAPAWLAKVHPRFHTPGLAIIVYGLLIWAMALSGTFLWALVLSAGSMMVYHVAVCAALIRLRRIQPGAEAMRAPFGRLLAVLGIGIALVLLTQLERTEIMFMGVTALIAAANWWWADRRSSALALAEAGERS